MLCMDILYVPNGYENASSLFGNAHNKAVPALLVCSWAERPQRAVHAISTQQDRKVYTHNITKANITKVEVNSIYMSLRIMHLL